MYDLDYIIIYADNSVTVPEEVIDAYKKINTPQFRNLRKQIVWMQACLEMHAMIYGIAPVEIVYRMYRKRPGYKVKKEEFLQIFRAVPEECNLCVIKDGKIIIKEILKNNLYLEIEKSQGAIEFYIPGYEEVLDCMDHKYPSKDPVYQELKKFLSTEMHLEETEVTEIVCTIWSRVSLGCDFHDVMDMLNEMNICFSSDQRFMKFADIMMRVNNHTRMLSNRGYTPQELVAEMGVGALQSEGLIPTLVPMSSVTADMLSSSKKELEERGFGIDLDSNAQVIQTGFMRDGSVERGQKKIYPNDPCPCGSGRKYKKCCGKKWG